MFKIMNKIKNFEIFNVCTGKPYSVLEIIKSYEKVNNLKFKIEYKKLVKERLQYFIKKIKKY